METAEKDYRNTGFGIERNLRITKENSVLLYFSNMVKPIELYSYQVMSINWMLRQESTLPRGSILGDNCRLGKVCTCLTLFTIADPYFCVTKQFKCVL